MSEDIVHPKACGKTYSCLFYSNGEVYQLGSYWAGWSMLLDALCTRLNGILEEVPGASLTVECVKEKFGGLRFYYSTRGLDAMRATIIDDAVMLAEEASEHICQRCGSPDAVQSSSGWIHTLCESCRNSSRREG